MGALGKLIAKRSRNLTRTRLSPCATLTPSRNGDPVVSFDGHFVTSIYRLLHVKSLISFLFTSFNTTSRTSESSSE